MTTIISPQSRRQGALNAVAKVPEITIVFWIIKVLTTGMGETTSDYLAHTFNPMLAVAFGGIVLAIALVLQFKATQYVPWVYWFAVAMVAVFGTMVADVLHVGFGIPYLVSTIFFAISLVVIFIAWYMGEKTLSIHSITNRRREVFYWATVMATFALGTAAGDMTATTMHLGYFSSGVMFSVLIVIVATGHYGAKSFLAAEHKQQSSNAVLAFWLAYILTRPLGASFADWIGVSHARGGLALGTGPVSLVLIAMIVCLVVYVSRHENQSV